MHSWCRYLNSNSLSGKVPVSLGGKLLHRASFKYAFIPISLDTICVSKKIRSTVLNISHISLSGKHSVTSEINLRWFFARSFTDNAGLCGIPGLPSCGPHLTAGAKVGIAFGSLFLFLLLVIFSICCWKRRQNILRAQQIAGNNTEIELIKVIDHAYDSAATTTNKKKKNAVDNALSVLW